jgi:protein SCO1/2
MTLVEREGFMSQDMARPDLGRRHREEVPSILIPIAFMVFVVGLLACTVPYIMSTPSMGHMASSGGGFRLIDGRGQVVTDRSWPGKFLLVYFGYTHCPDLCPTMLANIAGALDDLGAKADRIQPLFVTVDPQRDTPSVMKQYTALFSARIAGLTGTTTEVAEAAQEYGVRYLRQQTGPAPGDYEMEHSADAYLVYPSGDMALMIPPGQTSRAMASELAAQLP